MTDPYMVALVVHFMANTFGLCRDVSVHQAPPPKLATVLSLFGDS
jgi:hypothetical protein